METQFGRGELKMADIKWCESPNPADCLANGEWDLMVDYIKHESVVDFTIHTTEGTCADTGQAFKFSNVGALSSMYGGADGGDDMKIFANSTNAYPYFYLLGNSDIHLYSYYKVKFFNQTQEMFRFQSIGTLSTLYGGDDAGDDLEIHANSSDAEPNIRLEGAGGIFLEVADAESVIFQDGATGEQDFKFFRSGTISKLQGSDDTGDDMQIFANSTDAYPYIELLGNAGMSLNVASEESIYFNDAGEQFFRFVRDAARSVLYGSDDTGDDLDIQANFTDTYPFIKLAGDDYIELNTSSYVVFKEDNEQYFYFDHSSPTSFLYGSNDTGDDLVIYANTTDSCPSISLYGNVGIRSKIMNNTGYFEISTCSDEKLFEVVATNADKHVNFHCLDAKEFVLENRTTNPSSPTCLGRIWFRTDL